MTLSNIAGLTRIVAAAFSHFLAKLFAIIRFEYTKLLMYTHKKKSHGLGSSDLKGRTTDPFRTVQCAGKFSFQFLHYGMERHRAGTTSSST